MEHWCNSTEGGETKYVEEELSQCHFLHHKSHKAWSGIVPGLPRGELSYLAPLGSENISGSYFKQCFFRGGGVLPPRLSQTPRLPVPRQK